MRKINGKEFEELRLEYHEIIKDKETTLDELVMMFEFFREHLYVVDNEIKRRAWKTFQEKRRKEEEQTC